MHVFVTGASGQIASGVIPDLISAGHTVLGLARSDHSADAVRSLGAEVLRGDLHDLDRLSAGALSADGVIHLGFPDAERREGDLAGAVATDLHAIEALGSALKGTGKPFIGTNDTAGLVLAGHSGELTEQDGRPGGPRIDAENTLLGFAEHEVRAAVVRLPPIVHGRGRYGFASGLIGIARARGTSGFVEDGNNRWPAAELRDVGLLYRLALESAPAGARLHAVAEEGITLRDIATAIGEQIDVPVAAVPASEVPGHFGFLSAFIGLDNPTASRITREVLGWDPAHLGLLEDLGRMRSFGV